MTGWRYASAFMAVVALLLDAHTGVWAQASNERTDTFEQRFPPDQVTTPPGGEQPPRQPPAFYVDQTNILYFPPLFGACPRCEPIRQISLHEHRASIHAIGKCRAASASTGRRNGIYTV
jgi:hypothetical protein